MKPRVTQCLIVVFLTGTLMTCKVHIPSRNYGTLKGTTGEYLGNCMPSPDKKPCVPQPISTKIYITTPSGNFQPHTVIDSTVSNENGHFEIDLPVGTYSLFLKDGNDIACTRSECNPDCTCMPFTIVADSTVTLNPTLDHASW